LTFSRLRYGPAMTPDYAPSLLRSFERHLRAENRSDNTIESYLESIRQAEAFPFGGPVGRKNRGRLAPLGGVERALGKVRFARLIHSGARVLGGPAVRAACGGDLILTWWPPRVVRHDQGRRDGGPIGGRLVGSLLRPLGSLLRHGDTSRSRPRLGS
jgi:hypothetical protein